MRPTTVVRTPSYIYPYAWVILAVVYLASVVAPFNQFKVPPILPLLMEIFRIDLIQAGILMSSLALVGLILALPAGIILQRLGSKVTILIALGSLAVGAGLGAFAGTFPLLLASRVIEGLGIGLMGVAAPATIAMWFPPEKQGMPMGIWATWVPVGSVVTYNLAPMLANTWGWQSVWWVAVGFAVLMVALSGLLLRNAPALDSASKPGGTRLDLRQALANRDIWLLALEFTCFNLAMIGIATYYPTFLNEVRGYPLGQAGFIASLGSFAVIIAAPTAGWFSDRIGSRRLVIAIPFLAVAVLLLFPFKVTGWQIPATMIAQGILVAAIPTATFAAAPEAMRRPEWAGLGLGVVLIGQNVGMLFGPIIFSQVVSSMGWAMAGYVFIPVALLGFASAWALKIR